MARARVAVMTDRQLLREIVADQTGAVSEVERATFKKAYDRITDPFGGHSPVLTKRRRAQAEEVARRIDARATRGPRGRQT